MDISYYKKYEPIFGEYYLKREIGEGSYGKVFVIEREDMGKVYRNALKIVTVPRKQEEIEMLKAQRKDPSEYCKGVVNRIRTEVELMSELKGNSYIVSYENHKFIPHEDGIGWDILIQMELLTPLYKHIAKHSPTVKDILKLGIDISKALELCHRNNIVHRDVKPENIFVSHAGDYKLGDFGIAKIAESTGTGTKAGTQSYMAPEIFNGKRYNSSVDIYSLGLVLYTLLNDYRMPFEKADANVYTARVVANSKRLSGAPVPPIPHVPQVLNDIILKACEFDPEDRYKSISEMRRALETVSFRNTADNQDPNLEGGTLYTDKRMAPEEENTLGLEVNMGESSLTDPVTEYIEAATEYLPRNNISSRDMSEHVKGDFRQGRAPNTFPEKALKGQSRSKVIVAIVSSLVALVAVAAAFLGIPDKEVNEPELPIDPNNIKVVSTDWDWSCRNDKGNYVHVIMSIRNNSDKDICGISFSVEPDNGKLSNSDPEVTEGAPFFAQGYVAQNTRGLMVAEVHTNKTQGQYKTDDIMVKDVYRYRGNKEYEVPEGVLARANGGNNGENYNIENVNNPNDKDVTKDSIVVAVKFSDKSKFKFSDGATCAEGKTKETISAHAKNHREKNIFKDPGFDGTARDIKKKYKVYILDSTYDAEYDGETGYETFKDEYLKAYRKVDQ